MTTSSRKTTAAKTTAAKSTTTTRRRTTTTRASAKAATPGPEAPTPTVAAPELKKRELIDALAEQTGLKKRDVRTVAEAMLASMGQALAEGRSLNLPPMGKLRIKRSEGKAQGQIVTCKVRLMEPAEKDAADPLAEPADQG